MMSFTGSISLGARCFTNDVISVYRVSLNDRCLSFTTK